MTALYPLKGAMRRMTKMIRGEKIGKVKVVEGGAEIKSKPYMNGKGVELQSEPSNCSPSRGGRRRTGV